MLFLLILAFYTLHILYSMFGINNITMLFITCLVHFFAVRFMCLHLMPHTLTEAKTESNSSKQHWSAYQKFWRYFKDDNNLDNLINVYFCVQYTTIEHTNSYYTCHVCLPFAIHKILNKLKRHKTSLCHRRHISMLLKW